jgi:hypothetical protein
MVVAAQCSVDHGKGTPVSGVPRDQVSFGSFRPRSRENAPHFDGVRYPFHSENIGACTETEIFFMSEIPDFCEAMGHNLVQPRVDFFLSPVEVLEILHPLEVGTDDSACICKDIRDNEDAVCREDLVGLGSSGPVCAFNDKLCSDVFCVFFSDLILQCGRDKKIDVEGEKVSI